MFSKLSTKFRIQIFVSFIAHFLKVFLFLVTGVIIHTKKEYQDSQLTNDGASIQALPSINRFILTARLRLMGFPIIFDFF